MPDQDKPDDPAAAAPSPWLRAGLGCGLLAPLLWAAVIVVAGELRPGFDHVRQFISELGERGSAHADFMRYGGFVASGALHVAYAAAFFASLARRPVRRGLALAVALLIAVDGLGRIGAGIFACEPGCAAPQAPGQRLHGLAATLAFLSIAAAALLAARLFRADARLRPLWAYSLASGAGGLLALLLMSGTPPPAHAGLYERLASGTFSLWVLVSAAWLWRLGRRR